MKSDNKTYKLSDNDINKIQDKIDKIQDEIKDFNAKIEVINKTVQKGAGIEQDSLIEEISELRQEIAGLTARKENFENQLGELDRRKESLKNSIRTAEEDISIMTKEKVERTYKIKLRLFGK